jgi:hypothetical protein
MEVRDPIHGAIRVTDRERPVLDHPFVQRLRGVRATGFASQAFPSATHSRYAHSVGAMYLAGLAFDAAYERWTFHDSDARSRLRACVRFAALCHDLGHSPFSHCTEFAMPDLAALRIDWYAQVDPRKATHEDYTVAILANTDLGRAIGAGGEVEARHVAALVSHDVTVEDGFFVDGGQDHRRALSQIVSSELDVDRLDYLLRDSHFTGARYGEVDVGWLLSHLVACPDGNEVGLGLDERALYAFDDFLVARHHMFLMVYFHHKSVIYEEMLKRFVQEEGCTWRLSADLDRYLLQDDVDLVAHLRGAPSPWARRIVMQRPYARVLEVHGSPEDVDISEESARLKAAGIDVIEATSTGQLSRYEHLPEARRRAARLQVVGRLPAGRERQTTLPGLGGSRPPALEQATRIFERYADARRVARLFVAPEELARAQEILSS